MIDVSPDRIAAGAIAQAFAGIEPHERRALGDELRRVDEGPDGSIGLLHQLGTWLAFPAMAPSLRRALRLAARNGSAGEIAAQLPTAGPWGHVAGALADLQVHAADLPDERPDPEWE